MVGAFLGGLFYYYHKICVFFASGVLFTLVSIAIWTFFVQNFVKDVPLFVVYVGFVMTGILGGTVSYFLTQPALIVSTALGGSFLVITSALIIIDLPTFKSDKDGGVVQWEYYVLGGAWIALSIFSLGFQIYYRDKKQDGNDDEESEVFDDYTSFKSE